MKPKVTAVLGLLLSVAVVIGPLPAGATTGARPSPPPVDVDLTKEGAKAKASTKTIRLGSSRKYLPHTKLRLPARPPTTLSDIRPASRKKDIRLNLGICGMPAPGGGGRIGPARCEEDEPVEPDQPTPSTAVRRDLPRPEDVTWEQVLSETKNIAFPGLRVKVQPAERTLVNLDTIVYTDQAKVSQTTVSLLGFPVIVEATPMSYTWRFGDGTSVTTTSPGKPYPAKEITHKYLKRGSVVITLTTNYAARFNVDGTGWQYIDGTVPITGPATNLLVREAVPVLVEPSG